MSNSIVPVEFAGRVVMVGFGSIGQGVLPLLLRHLTLTSDRITIISPEDAARTIADKHGIKFIKEGLRRENFKRILEPLLGRGDFLVNVSVDVSSVALIRYCWEAGSLYIDTCVEPWAGGYTDASLPPGKRTNYVMREEILALREKVLKRPTALITHGANPGLVSHLVKQALLNIAKDTGVDASLPADRAAWGALAQKLGIRTIHIAERDSQISTVPKRPNEFVNTWSVDGFVSEGGQPAELGWGSHEKVFPRDAKRHESGCGAAIYLMQAGVATRVRTWTPKAGPIHGFLITHSEAIAIADYYSVLERDKVIYRPTVHYAYHPSDAAVLSIHEFCGRSYQVQDRKRIMMDDITEGIDELGVLLGGHKKNAYWFGSQLSVQEARKLAPYNNATSLQVTASVLSGMIWCIENPNRGLVEPDEIDFQRNLEICMPYLGPVSGTYTDWTPLSDRERLFPEELDKTDPWQFRNVRVS
jgi:homospermidine synthase